jgi:hypothetical protein
MPCILGSRWKQCLALLIAFVAVSAVERSSAAAAEFGGFLCDTTCVVHREGYNWARSKKITRDSECADALRVDKKSRPFFEGCIVYIENPSRGSRFDDSGKEIK